MEDAKKRSLNRDQGGLVVHDPRLSTEEADKGNVITTSLEQLLRESDYIYLLCPLHIVNK